MLLKTFILVYFAQRGKSFNLPYFPIFVFVAYIKQKETRIRKVLEDIDPKKDFGIVTDNPANMKYAWICLKDCYPHLHCYDCISHSLNLLFTELLKLTTLKVLMSQGTDIVKEIKIVISCSI